MSSQISNLILLCLFHMFHTFNGEWVENKGLWYYISRYEQPVGYEKAADICGTLKARLAVLTYEDQNEFLEGITEDGESRWIGLSSNKTSYFRSECKNDVYVWNYDWFCDITYSNFDNYNHKNEQHSCSGVAFSNGKWIAKDCLEHHGFICQWECKRIYMHFESTEYSGVYKFGRYYNNDFRYFKEGDTDYRIYISGNFEEWVVVKYKSNKIYKYLHEAGLYVPYKDGMSWTTRNGDSTNAASVCVECDHLSVCLFPQHSEKICFNDMRLTPNSSYPQYTNNDGSAVLKYNPNSDTSSQCIGIKPLGISLCGYLFPYPKKTTNYTIHYNRYTPIYYDTVSIINKCIHDHIEVQTTPVSLSPPKSTVSNPSQTTLPARDATSSQTSIAKYTSMYDSYETTSSPAQSVSYPSQAYSAPETKNTDGQTSIVEYTTSTYETTNNPPLFLENKQDNKIISLSVSIPAVVITIIIVVAILSFICIRRRKRNEQYSDDPGGVNTRTDNITNAQFNNNVYIELPESNSKRTIQKKTDKDSDGGDYSYANFAIHGTRQAFKEIVETPTLKENPSSEANNVEAQNKGYLAPDYGVLYMDKNAKAEEKRHSNNTHDTNAVYLETTDSKAKSISQSPGQSDSDDDLKLHENDVYDTSADNKQSDNEQSSNVYYNDGLTNAEHGLNPQATHKNHSNEECLYQNAVSDSVDGGDHDLELFENSVYEHT